MRWWGRLGKSSILCSSDVLMGMMLIGDDSVLCSELAVKLIDEPFIAATDDKDEWAL